MKASPLPRVVGTHRVYPPLLAEQKVSIAGEEVSVGIVALAGPHTLSALSVIATGDVPEHPWQPMETAPRTGDRILVLTADFGVVEAWWDVSVPNFWKSRAESASYDPENAQGDWVSEWRHPDGERRLFCGATPKGWMPRPPMPPEDDIGCWVV